MAANTRYADSEWKQGLQEQVYRLDVRRSATKAAIMRISSKGNRRGDAADDVWWRCGLAHGLAQLWTSRKALKLRLRLWRFLQSIRHSSHLRHAAKAACGVALLTFPAFMPIDSAGLSVPF